MALMGLSGAYKNVLGYFSSVISGRLAVININWTVETI